MIRPIRIVVLVFVLGATGVAGAKPNEVIDLAQRSSSYQQFLALRQKQPLLDRPRVFFASDTVVVAFTTENSGPSLRLEKGSSDPQPLWLSFVHLSSSSISELKVASDDGRSHIAVFPDGTVVLNSAGELLQVDRDAQIVKKVPLRQLCEYEVGPGRGYGADVYAASEEIGLAVVQQLHLVPNRLFPQTQDTQAVDFHYCWFDRRTLSPVATATALEGDRRWTTVRGLNVAGHYKLQKFQISPNGVSVPILPCQALRAYFLRQNAVASVCARHKLLVTFGNGTQRKIRIPIWPALFDDAWYRPRLTMVFGNTGTTAFFGGIPRTASYRVEVWDYQKGKRMLQRLVEFDSTGKQGYSGEFVDAALEPGGNRLAILLNGRLEIYSLE